ncbi:MAG: metal-dependent hydrolase [Chloroflexi bacterium]|nr:metal-dependent hydrolase [Chloroflexota bacterium]
MTITSPCLYTRQHTTRGDHPSAQKEIRRHVQHIAKFLSIMILPGHIAASTLCHRYIKVDLSVALAAGLAPDLVDKVCYYVLRLMPGSRVPMHTLWAWLLSTLLVAGLAFGLRRERWRDWPWAWFLAYGAHLLCDSPLVGGKLPFLWPLRTYDFTSPVMPLSFLFGLDSWPLHTLLAEASLTAFTLYVYRRQIETRLSRIVRRRMCCKPGAK